MFRCRGMGEAMNFQAEALNLLKAQGLRITKARVAILRELDQAEHPLTALELAQALKDQGEAIDQVSCYRTLELLSQLKLIHKVMAGGYVKCCGHEDTHQHLVISCQSCSRVREIHVPRKLVKGLSELVADHSGFIPDLGSLQLSGLCSRCHDWPKN